LRIPNEIVLNSFRELCFVLLRISSPPSNSQKRTKNTKKISYASLVPRAVWNLLSVSKNSSLLATTSSCLANARG
jgi:hypothetical protein